MPHVMVFSIGPVQDFIATARRSRDLWFGSRVLSELAKAAALEILKLHGDNPTVLIFPAVKGLNDLHNDEFSVPNKIIAEVSRVSPPEIGKSVVEAIHARLSGMREEAFRHVKARFQKEEAVRQVKDLPEIYWSAVEVQGDDYKRARNEAEALLAARKNTRNFAPVTWGGNVPKSSLDGLRESVIPEEVFNNKEYPPERLRELYGVRQGERLCGVGLLKRHGERGNGNRICSTSHVAAMPLLARMIDPSGKLVDGYINQLSSLGLNVGEHSQVPIPHPVFDKYDGHLLFEERLSEFLQDQPLADARKALSKFLESATGGKRPLPYFALIHADGDRMGKAISGCLNADSHRELSRRLGEFASGVREIVEKHKGSLVYAGGDDVLAFVPLHKAVECAQRLAADFAMRLKEFPADEKDKSLTPTLSVGIGVGHHLEPLSDTLQLARDAEKAAKKVDGKNALAVSVSKRGGTVTTVAGTWGKLDERLQWFIKLHRVDAVPDGAAYELRDLTRRLTVVDAVKKEAVRILKRKRSEGGSKEIEGNIRKRLETLVDEISVEQLADELIVARIFADAENLANQPLHLEGQENKQ